MNDKLLYEKTWFLHESASKNVRLKILNDGYCVNPKQCELCGKIITGARRYDIYLNRIACSNKCSSRLSGERVTKSRLASKQSTLDASIILTRSKVISLLNSEKYHYIKYMGKGKDKLLLKDNSNLYISILHHTKELEHMYKGSKMGLTCRLIIAAEYNFDVSDITCKCGSKILFNPTTQKIGETIYCRKCKPSANSKEYYQYKYGDMWEEKWTELIQLRSKIAKENINFMNSCNPPVSKISLKLFDAVASQLTEIPLYGEMGELVIRLSPEESGYILEKTGISRNSFYIDFTVGNKIIEFNGDYWHSKTQCYDNERKYILEQRGYDVMFIKECEFKQDKQLTIRKCVDYING